MPGNIITPREFERWRKRRENYKKLYELKDRPDTLPLDIDEHFHILYENIPDFNHIYLNSRDAYAEVKRVGEHCEPNTEWYEDGRVMIETRLPGRTGLHRVTLEVSACVRRTCTERIKGVRDAYPDS